MRKALSFLRKLAFAAGSALYLFTLGLRSRRHRALITAIAEHFGYARHARAPLDLPEVDLADVVTPTTSFQLREPLAVDGNVTLYELVAIASIVSASRPQSLVEIGTFDGRTTLNMACNAPPGSEVFTLDLPRAGARSSQLALDPEDIKYVEKDASGTRFRGTDCEPRITQLYGDSASFDFSAHLGQVDLVFVDGSHSYEYVISDSRLALSLLRGGTGVVLWHDYGQWPGVTTALNELARSDAAFSGMRRIRGTSLVYVRTEGAGRSRRAVAG